MAGRPSGSQPARPVLAPKLSSSVPSTPHQRPRHGFGTGSRSPSPRGLSGSRSPRSTISEAVGSLASAGKVRSFCKYEKTPALSKRRMPYNIGDAPLDSPPNKPKERLDPDEEKKLSGDMRELYDRLLPTKESDNRRRQFIDKLHRILHQEWPDHEFTVHVFGSSGNLLCTSDSDVDICIQTPMKELESMHILAAALDTNGMQNVLCIPAKVPIVKIWDPEFKLAADLNVNNTLALENTRLIKTYIQIDERVRPLAMVIKHWTRMRILNDAGIGGTISSYAWICLILNFLQTRQPPILPSLHLYNRPDETLGDSLKSSFDDSLEGLEGFGSENTSTVGELLFQFFRYYGYEFEYDAHVVSVRHGKLLTREEKRWTATSKDGQWRLCVEEPFNTYRNLGNSADATSFRGIHLELRDAFINICNLKIDKLMEAYEYPPEDKQGPSIFKKPPAVPKPTLTAAPASSHRKGSGSMRGNRHNNRGHYSGFSNRRASAGSTYGRGGQGPFSPPLAYTDFNQQMANGWAMLQQHAANLKQQQIYGNVPLHPVQPYPLAFANAQNLAQGGVPAHRELNPTNMKSTGQRMFSNSLSNEPVAGSAASLQPGFQMNPLDPTTALLQAAPHDGPRTNPSSPSLGNSVPARRGMQRTSVSNGNSAASIRSQSQPARGMPPNMILPFQIVYDPATGMPYYAMPNYDNALTQQALEQQYGYIAAIQNGVVQQSDQQPKEYVGYYVENTPPYQLPHLANAASLPRASSHADLAHRRDAGRDKLSPLDLSSNRKLSRSPSPLGHTREAATPPKSAPLPAASSSRTPDTRQQAGSNKVSSPPVVTSASAANPLRGLLIVNGSSYTSDSDRYTNGSYVTPVREEKSNNAIAASDSSKAGSSSIADNGASEVSTESSVENDQAQFGMRLSDAGADSSQVSSTIGSPIQPFPSYNEATMPLMSQDEEVVTSPTRIQHSPWQSFGVSNSATMPISIPKDPKEATKSPSNKPVPFLSPVIESRMPTPQMQRRIEQHKQQAVPIANGSTSNGMAGPKTLPVRSIDPIPPTPNSSGAVPMSATNSSGPAAAASAVANSSSNGSNQWQTQTQGKRRNGARRRSKSASVTTSDSSRASNNTPATAVRKLEPLPAHPQDRKGG